MHCARIQLGGNALHAPSSKAISPAMKVLSPKVKRLRLAKNRQDVISVSLGQRVYLRRADVMLLGHRPTSIEAYRIRLYGSCRAMLSAAPSMVRKPISALTRFPVQPSRAVVIKLPSAGI